MKTGTSGFAMKSRRNAIKVRAEYFASLPTVDEDGVKVIKCPPGLPEDFPEPPNVMNKGAHNG